MPQDRRDETLPELRHRTFDDALGRRIVDTHIRAVREGPALPRAYHLFDGYCQRLVIDGFPRWAHAAMETLHPQWNGYGYTWRRDLNAIAPENYSHGEENERIFVTSPFYALMQRARAGRTPPRCVGISRTVRRSAISDSGGVPRAGRYGLFCATFHLR